MNKTVNINLGGFFYHIDEDAYQKLNRYFEAIKSSLSHESREEVMNDIESRISELFAEKIQQANQVLSLQDIDDVIAVMGQPEDYKIEGENIDSNNYTYSSSPRAKKLYRDTEKAKIAGVCSGLGHYFGIEAVWIRIALILLIFAGFGTGVLLYIILWAVTPEAVTTSEKLEMRGEPITISNIEKKVREEFENVSEKFKNTDFQKINENVKENVNKFNDSFRSTANKTGGELGNVIILIATAFAKLIGAFIIFISAITIIGMLITLFTLGSTRFVHVPWLDYYNSFNYTGVSLWMISLLFFLAISIPFFFLLILGLKILVSNLRSIGNIAKYTLLAIWLISIFTLITIGIQTSNEVAITNKVVKKEKLNITAQDTLEIKFIEDNYFNKNSYNNDEFQLVQDSIGREMIYMSDIRFEIMPTDESQPFIQLEKEANGKTFMEAKDRASTIEYGFKILGNKIIFNNYFLTSTKNKYRGQEVKIYLYLPKGYLIKPDASLERFDRTDGDYFTFYTKSNDYVYRVGERKIKCINCPSEIDEDDNWDNDDDSDYKDKNVSIHIDEKGVRIEKDSTESNSKDIKELKIDKNGIIIKTK